MIIPFAQKAKELVEAQKFENKSQRELESFEDSCYRVLKKVIRNAMPNHSTYETAYALNRRMGIGNLKMIFDDCTKTVEKTQTQSKEM